MRRGALLVLALIVVAGPFRLANADDQTGIDNRLNLVFRYMFNR